MSYTVRAGCSNCGNKWTPNIPEGTSRDEWVKTAICPKCKTSGHIWSSKQD